MRIALALHRAGLRSDLLHGLGFASIVGSLAFWGRSGTAEDRFAKARAERLAIFVGLWPPTLFLLGKVLQDLERPPGESADRIRRPDEESVDETLKAA
jgi:hypothetical protein